MPSPWDFGGVLEELYHRQNVVGAAVLGGLAEAMALPPETLARHFVAGDMGTVGRPPH